MKRKLAMLLCLTALLTCGAHAGSVEVSAPPALALTTDAGGVVTVEGTDLIVDLSGGAKDDLGLSPLARVTASYQVSNPTQSEQTVAVALPFASPIESSRARLPQLSVDGSPVDCQVYYGGRTTDVSLADLGTGEALSTVLQASPQEMPAGTMYTFIPVVDVETFLREEIQIRFYVRAKFRCDQPLIYGGFGGVTTLEDGRLEMTAWIWPEREEWPLLTVFLPGGGTLEECEINGYDDYIGIRTPLGVEMTHSVTEDVSFSDYLAQYMVDEDPQAWERSYWSILADMERDESGLPAQDIQEVPELMKLAQEYDRLAMAAVELTLAPGQTRTVTAAIDLSGSVDQPDDPETGDTTYIYTWLPQPARAWAAFGGLDLTIIPPKGLTVAADFALTQREDGASAAHWDGLPEELTFTLAPAPQPEPMSLTWLPFAIGAAVIIVIGAGILVMRRGKK